MLTEMTAAELEASCRTYVALQTGDMGRTLAILSQKYRQVQQTETSIRVYDPCRPEDIVSALYKNGILVREIKTCKIGLEEYYMDLMQEGRA